MPVPTAKAGMSEEVGAYKRVDQRRTHHTVTFLDVQNPPQIPKHGGSDGEEGKETDHLAAQRASQAETCCQ